MTERNLKEKERKMTNTQKALEFDTIKEKLAELAYTKRAKEKLKDLKPLLSEAELMLHLRETTQARKMIEKCGQPPATALQDIDSIVETAVKGGCLTGEQLELFSNMLTAVKRLRDYLNQCKQYEIGLAYYDENLDTLDSVREEIVLKIRSGKVDDYASRHLKAVRSTIEQSEAKMREKAESVLRSNKECMSDSFSTIRNGHVCIPVKKEYKHKISGSVIDKSSTGNTLFIEPASVCKIYSELQELRIDEENEERRILYTLTAMVAEAADVVENNTKTIEKLDFVFAKAKISLEYEGVEPHINTDRRIKLVNGRHPLMDRKMNVPLQFQIGDEIRGIVITGPNTGGKTVAIKTVALNCLMAQCGLHVACEEADICMNNQILCDIGDGQNISENLSTFSSHIMNVLEILKKADKDSLIIMDELGSGTDPTEGMGIAIAILTELKKSGALYLVTTHYPEVKNYASSESGVVNARMTFDKDSLKPLYQLVIGEAGESCAFYIAQRLGMPAAMLKCAAAAAYGEEGVFASLQNEEIAHTKGASIRKKKKTVISNLSEKFQRGDSVMIFPDKKLGIVCEPVNEKGVLRVQLPDKKIWINHTRVKLQVAAAELYPPDYDFSIIFDTVENRKLRHQMERKYVETGLLHYEE